MSIFKLKGKIQDYGWGGYDFIPNLTGENNPDNKPIAELWMGTHHKGTAEVEVSGEWKNLDTFIQADPFTILGEEVGVKFSQQLPFLFKILDVRQMLSIQAHPTKAAAERGFAFENEIGISLTAKHRNYRDDNHKPEIMVALTNFWLLHGFKSKEAIAKVLDTVPEFDFLKPYFKNQDIKELYQYIMELPQNVVDNRLKPLKARLLPLYKNKELAKNTADFWAARAFDQDVLNNGHEDRGVFSIYLYNLVNIKPGLGIFQDAGVPHAYLEGVNVELMANSDNVFRGGLTYKHIDVKELLTHLVFDEVTPQILEGEEASDTERVYKTPAPDFELSKIDIDKGQIHQRSSVAAPEIVIVIDGEATVECEEATYTFSKGEIFFAPAEVYYTITGIGATLFKASVPL